jgi:hypothetical protein
MIEGFGEEFIWLILVLIVGALFSFLLYRNSLRSSSNPTTPQQEPAPSTQENENLREQPEEYIYYSNIAFIN